MEIEEISASNSNPVMEFLGKNYVVKVWKNYNSDYTDSYFSVEEIFGKEKRITLFWEMDMAVNFFRTCVKRNLKTKM